MGKRSTFERIPHDLYDTPAKAVGPLLRRLKPKTRFIEPCYGNGALARVLMDAGHQLIERHDLLVDARVNPYNPASGVIFITNPPFWGRPADLHPLIENLSNQAPTWLLMPGDWLFNKSSSPFIRRLRRVVAIGRVKWIPDSAHISQDNAAWLLFDQPAARLSFFVGSGS